MKIYKNSLTQIIHGKAEEALDKQVNDSSVDLIFVDPPYNIGKKFSDFHDKWSSDEEYAKWCYNWIDLCVKKLKPNGSMYLMTSTQAMSYLDLHIRNKMDVLSRIVWFYDSSGVQAKKYYGSLWEPILFCVKNKNAYTFNADNIMIEAKTGAKRKLIDYRGKTPRPYNTQKIPGNVWEFNRVRYRMDEYENHPSQKPEALLERIIIASSNEGDTILDPFSGTFTTCAVAQRLGRKSIGIELQEEYIKIGLRRLNITNEYKGKILENIKKPYIRKNSKYNDNITQQGLLNYGS
ncbi:adenine-specific DNA-methyltransferase [Campylobacter jejuni]|uniref:adenine-specific DNA-methyltransferase n=1 Tax=Campylobacter jejuni TaxID=197 RepID=UPI0008749808|nr:adenine-specific DNA-methyltransferase [Campylobacter jejuni]EAI3980255.1 adenine-specific DNA-methyltransferase [Campylobacter jejuni]EAI3983874.1 adenine-specific DNA-methyltransferase [Campylobacter jejuni]EAK0278243.1 adenine-specific DNA-methyltransferase [Campylobacter jejuni]EIX0489385.1 adenine-specific DNA-methyltransferase [Campylobacter jejuni]MCW1314067.1 adenine-specific DNA-methyltransferase [Campylobacter jejuni]